MSLVCVRYKTTIDPDTVQNALPVLCATVADQLSCEHNNQKITVTPEMVKVRFEQTTPYDLHMPDVYIEIEARAFEARMPRLGRHAAELCAKLEPLLPGVHFSVWYKLCHGVWESRHAQPSYASSRSL